MFDGMKVFSASKAREREFLGEMVTDWIATNLDKEIVDKEVRQSSDTGWHCLSIVIFWRQRRGA